MVTFETERLGTRHARRNPDLAHVVRFRSRRISFDKILKFAREYRTIRVTRNACWVVGGEHEHDWAGDVACCFGGNPALVFGVLLGFRFGLAGLGGCLAVSAADLALFRLVAFECEGFDHF